MTGAATFQVVGREYRLPSSGGWDDPALPKLLRYNLHYFDDLNARDAGGRANWHRALIDRWLAENPVAQGTGWEPYPTSLRIVNWVKWALSGHEPGAAAHDNLATQARWLRRRLEYHLLGNHLLANAKALVFAGLYFQGSEAQEWLEHGKRVLRRQLAEQILADGGHFELSPMYHSAVLEDLLDLVNVSTVFAQAPDPAWLAPLPRMQRWLATMTHPNGEIAFFNDAALDGCPATAELEKYASFLGIGANDRPASKSHAFFEASGYVRAVTDRFDVFIDVAAVGPDHLPGHAHADTLSFEISAFGSRCVVNSGTSLYDDGDERLRQRSTAAHNTVVVDGRNSSDVWGSFRVGKRARVRDRSVDLHGERAEIAAAHDGYRDLGVVHRRSWTLEPERLTITDRLEGRGTHRIEWPLHFHPGIAARLDGHECHVSCSSGSLRIELDPALSWRIEPSTYHPRFGACEPNLRLIGTLTTVFPVTITTALVAR